jgi:hypothetical protein
LPRIRPPSAGGRGRGLDATGESGLYLPPEVVGDDLVLVCGLSPVGCVCWLGSLRLCRLRRTAPVPAARSCTGTGRPRCRGTRSTALCPQTIPWFIPSGTPFSGSASEPQNRRRYQGFSDFLVHEGFRITRRLKRTFDDSSTMIMGRAPAAEPGGVLSQCLRRPGLEPRQRAPPLGRRCSRRPSSRRSPQAAGPRGRQA